MKPFTLAAQVATLQPVPGSLSLEKVLTTVSGAQSILPLSALIIGSYEIPEIYDGLIDLSARRGVDAYLWYNLFSDYPGQNPSDDVINWRGERGEGWNKRQGNDEVVRETFRFSCPNNPEVRQKTLYGLAAILRAYPFQGIFLDKLRFPSPAGGMEMTFSCFCPHCYQAAAKFGLDLDQVKACLQDWKRRDSAHSNNLIPPGSPWLEALCKDYPLIQKFLRFRADAITTAVREVRELTVLFHRKLALDLFSPAFAALVGQDYPALAQMVDWVKPMTYRAALGPAGLRLETKSLVEGMSKIYSIPEEDVLLWVEQNCPGFSLASYRQMVESLVPLNWMRTEILNAGKSAQPTPVLIGLETVAIPGVIQTTPEQVRSMLTLGIDCEVQGAVLSWDLLNTPLENLYAIQDCLA